MIAILTVSQMIAIHMIQKLQAKQIAIPAITHQSIPQMMKSIINIKDKDFIDS